VANVKATVTRLKGSWIVSAVTDQSLPGDVPASATGGTAAAPQRPRVFLHIGEPKTGSTFLQQVIWRNRAALAAQGVVLPGHHPQDHFRASQDLRGLKKLASDPAGSWTGEWDILARQSKQAPVAAVISHELFAAADAEHARQAVDSLQPAEVHVVLTARDMAALLPAEWQESVKHRNARGWEDWLADVIDRESLDSDRRQWWFWRVHDTLAILQLWSRYVPANRIHVLTTPRRGADPGLLWERFAGLLEVDPASVDISRARANASLGLVEVEFLRRLNAELSGEIPDWFYMWTVKEGLAHAALAARQADARLVLPPERTTWASEYADTLISGLRDGGYDLVGDVAELRPPDVAEVPVNPANQPAQQILDTAIQATAALVLNQYRKEYPAAHPQATVGALADRVTARVNASPRIKRTLRELSSRHSSVRWLRVLAWRVLERSRARSSS
jgi:hypothetical protein